MLDGAVTCSECQAVFGAFLVGRELRLLSPAPVEPGQLRRGDWIIARLVQPGRGYVTFFHQRAQVLRVTDKGVQARHITGETDTVPLASVVGVIWQEEAPDG